MKSLNGSFEDDIEPNIDDDIFGSSKAYDLDGENNGIKKPFKIYSSDKKKNFLIFGGLGIGICVLLSLIGISLITLNGSDERFVVEEPKLSYVIPIELVEEDYSFTETPSINVEKDYSFTKSIGRSETPSINVEKDYSFTKSFESSETPSINVEKDKKTKTISPTKTKIPPPSKNVKVPYTPVNPPSF